MILYALDTRWNLGEISEWEVERETPKTYTVKKRDRIFPGYSRGAIIRKETMRYSEYKYFLSREEAIEEYRQLLKVKIAYCLDAIERETKKIADFQKRLQELEKK